MLSTNVTLRLVAKARKVWHRKGRFIVVSSMPKSGSTFLTRVLAELTGYQHWYLAHEYGNVEQELYLPRVVDAYGRGTVTQQHFKGNRANLDLLRSFQIKPVVLVRDIFDSVVSVRDHLVRENPDNLPGLEVADEFSGFSGERQLDFVIDCFVPWYLSFYVSWRKAEAEDRLGFMWVRYEDAVTDWPTCVSMVADFSELPCTKQQAVAAVEKVSGHPEKVTRLNVGVMGRGVQALSEAQRSRIRNLSGYYPSIDFKLIGL